jgi:serine/threonine-protein kinase RsbW
MLRPGGMDGNDPGTTRFAADGQAVGTALAAVRRFAEANALPADATARLAIIVEELVANLVEHGGAPGAPIELRLAHGQDRIGLTLFDSGVFFDPRTAPDKPIIPERGGGAGIALVLAWARIADYTRTAQRNRLDLDLPLRR